MKIGNVELRSNLILAPMAGVTDVGFREVCCKMGAGLTYTEMVSAKGFYYNSKKTFDLIQTFDGEHPVAVQLFGSEPDIFRSVISSGILDKFDIIDINMGCPAPKIVKNGDGSALLKDIDKAREIIKAAVSATTKPVTVKFRIGFNNGDNVAVEFAKMCEEAGASAICVHGRTREQGYSGQVDYDTIADVKRAVSIPVIGNGDVVDIESYYKMLATGVDAVMIGRGAMGHPELFSILQGKEPCSTHLELIKEHIAVLNKYGRMSPDFKKHLLWYVSGYKGSSDIKLKLMKCGDSEYMDILTDFFESSEKIK